MPIAELASNQLNAHRRLKLSATGGVLKSEKRPGFLSMMRFFNARKGTLTLLPAVLLKQRR
jgi:hypothetical protein